MNKNFFGEHTKLCVPLMAKNKEELISFCEAIKDKTFDMVEWRVDAMEGDDWEGMYKVLKSYFPDRPILTTLRTKAEGGLYMGGNYAALLERIIDLGLADIIDMETLRVNDGNLLTKARQKGMLVLFSYHRWDRALTLDELMEKYQEMFTKSGDILKIAMIADTYQDTANILYAASAISHKTKKQVIGIAMGEKGKISRIAGPMMGAPISFISLVGNSAPGQWEAEKAKLVLKELDFVE